MDDTKAFFTLTFKLPFKGKKKKTDEPTYHENGIMKLNRSLFGVPNDDFDTGFIDLFDQSRVLSFEMIQP
ncbi:hypothetical protein FNH22_06370 [Fulvivirga sp. M361]|uniref:hypothetical protein n=1 Tax=Fulvivirga sp. M361 TaxID=2594266 RepID=UPI00117B5256|nr:hypothetical protein [Fulvivirga sp. M361]TRX60665.1 hypothetical protein FNH22_06370 [Fulvivirga sp. M361]